MEIMTNNVVLMFSPNNKKIPYEQREPDLTVIRLSSVGSHVFIVHKFLIQLCMDQA